MLCKDCVACVQDLEKAGVAFEFLDFSHELVNLKTFFAIRDGNPLFAKVKAAGGIGIPCILEEDGTVSLDWEKYLR